MKTNSKKMNDQKHAAELAALSSPPARGHASAVCYLKLFHGRKTPDEQLHDWGSEGPVIGPVGITWTYGNLKLHSPDWSEFEELRFVDGLIHYGDIYYGDCELLVAGDPVLRELQRLGREFHDYAMFRSHLPVTPARSR